MSNAKLPCVVAISFSFFFFFFSCGVTSIWIGLLAISFLSLILTLDRPFLLLLLPYFLTQRITVFSTLNFLVWSESHMTLALPRFNYILEIFSVCLVKSLKLHTLWIMWGIRFLQPILYNNYASSSLLDFQFSFIHVGFFLYKMPYLKCYGKR